MNRFVSILTLIFALLALSGCGHPRRGYPDTDAFWKGEGRLPVPAEFRHGTATRADVDAWSCSLLGNHPIESRRIDIDGEGNGELFISQPAHAGTGGNSHLVFREGRRGFRYLGRLSFGGLRLVGADSDGRVRLMTSSRMGGGECMVTIHELRPDGFHPLATRVLPCGDSATDGEGGRVFKLLFESEVLDENILRVVFGGNY
jgi:hypothetical protein